MEYLDKQYSMQRESCLHMQDIFMSTWKRSRTHNDL